MTRALGAAALVAALAVAVAVRLGWSELLPYYDEIQPLRRAAFRTLLAEGETAINPPVYRWLITRPEAPADRLALGRAVAFVGALFGVLAASLAARRAAGWTAAVATALGLAALPDAVRIGAEARAYGLTAAAVAAHLLAVVAPPGRASWALLAASAAAIPWLHYSAVPWLGVVGLAVLASRRDAPTLGAYLAAALTTLPLVPAVLAGAAEREPPREAALRVAGHVIGLGLDGPLGGARIWPPGTLALVIVGAALAGGLVGWRRLDGPARTLVVAALAWPVSAAVVGTVQLVRPPVYGVAAHVIVPAVVVLATRRHAALGLAVGLVLLGLGVPSQELAREGLEVPRRAEADAARAVAARLGPEPVRVAPPSRVPVLAFLAAGAVPPWNLDDCAPHPTCAETPRGAILGVRGPGPGTTLVFGDLPRAPGCEAQAVTREVAWVICPPAPAP